jgi:hypothetical protein
MGRKKIIDGSTVHYVRTSGDAWARFTAFKKANKFKTKSDAFEFLLQHVEDNPPEEIVTKRKFNPGMVKDGDHNETK